MSERRVLLGRLNEAVPQTVVDEGIMLASCAYNDVKEEDEEVSSNDAGNVEGKLERFDAGISPMQAGSVTFPELLVKLDQATGARKVDANICMPIEALVRLGNSQHKFDVVTGRQLPL